MQINFYQQKNSGFVKMGTLAKNGLTTDALSYRNQSANQWTDFFIIETSAMKELKQTKKYLW